MRQPLAIGQPIDSKRITSWTNLFSGYRNNVTRLQIEEWLNQFSAKDRDLAARILDCVEFVSFQQINAAYRCVLEGMLGWNIDHRKRQGKWRFVPFSGSSGESGDSMLHIFRRANKLNYRQFNDLFIYRSELFSENLGPNDTVVLVDDFAGTGDRVCDAWTDVFEELLPGNPSIILILVRSITAGRKRIEKETNLSVHTYLELTEKDNIFSGKCKYFSDNDKNVMFRYCQKADKRSPKGYGDSGCVLVFAHNCPSNSIPILHANNRKWCGLFPRSY